MAFDARACCVGPDLGPFGVTAIAIVIPVADYYLHRRRRKVKTLEASGLLELYEIPGTVPS